MPDHTPEDDASAHARALPGVMEALLRAEADFAHRLRAAAPLPDGNPKDPAYFELMARHDRYVPSAEVTAVARLLYMLGAYGVTDAAAMDRLIEAHNERMAELAGDADYIARMRVPKSRLLEARFSGPARRNAVANVREHGRAALDGTALGRLLVEFANKTQVDEAVRLLAALGFFRRVEGDYNSGVYLSTGRLEALYRGYLAQVAQGVDDPLGRTAGGTPGRRDRDTEGAERVGVGVGVRDGEGGGGGQEA